jgi:hypothetical protein
MNSGSVITGNKASIGGGVGVAGGTFTMNGNAAVSGNTANLIPDVSVRDTAASIFKISGAPTARVMLFYSGAGFAKITQSAALAAGANITVDLWGTSADWVGKPILV